MPGTDIGSSTASRPQAEIPPIKPPASVGQVQTERYLPTRAVGARGAMTTGVLPSICLLYTSDAADDM
eukprot:3256779-Rhodomonas_salina.1